MLSQTKAWFSSNFPDLSQYFSTSASPIASQIPAVVSVQPPLSVEILIKQLSSVNLFIIASDLGDK